MTNQTLKFSDFEKEKLPRNQQKTIHGGEEFIDPSKGEGKGATKP